MNGLDGACGPYSVWLAAFLLEGKCLLFEGKCLASLRHLNMGMPIK